MKQRFFFIFTLTLLVSFASGQNATLMPTYKIKYKGYIELDHDTFEKKGDKFEETVLRSGQRTVAWHAWLPSYNNPASNDSILYSPITDNDRKERFLLVYKNHDSSSIVSGYNSGMLKVRKKIFASYKKYETHCNIHYYSGLNRF